MPEFLPNQLVYISVKDIPDLARFFPGKEEVDMLVMSNDGFGQYTLFAPPGMYFTLPVRFMRHFRKEEYKTNMRASSLLDKDY